MELRRLRLHRFSEMSAPGLSRCQRRIVPTSNHSARREADTPPPRLLRSQPARHPRQIVRPARPVAQRHRWRAPGRRPGQGLRSGSRTQTSSGRSRRAASAFPAARHHRTRAASRAISRSRAGANRRARARPPLRPPASPPRRPRSAAARPMSMANHHGPRETKRNA